jgi:hypothetical protein
MTSAPPTKDLLITADKADEDAHTWFPADQVRHCKEYLALEGIRFRNVYLTSKAIEMGAWPLFQIIYINARITGGKVLHVSDYRESS